METNDCKAIKSGFWYVIVNFAIRGISFITLPVFTRLMSTDEMGQFVNFSTWITLLYPVLTLNMESSIVVAKYDYKEKIDDYISSVLVLGSTLTILSYVISFFFRDNINEAFNINNFQLHIIFLYLMFSPAMAILQIKSRLDYKYKTSIILSLMSAVLFTVISMFAVLMSDDKLFGRIIGFYLPAIFLNICIYLYFLIKSKKIKIEYWRYGLIISIPLIFHTLAGNLLNSSDRVMINSIIGNSSTALYGIAYSCATTVSLLWYSLNQAWAPWAYEQMDKNNHLILKQASKIYMILFGLIVLCFMLVAPEILWLMGGTAYKEALNVIPPVMCGFVFQLVYSFYINIETIEKKTVYVAIGTIIAAVVNIVLNYLLIPKFGYVAAAYTTLVGYATLFIVHFLFVKKIGKTYWYDSRFNVSFLLFFCITSSLIILIYKFVIIRYAIIFLILFFFGVKLLSYKKGIIEAIKKGSLDELIRVIMKVSRT